MNYNELRKQLVGPIFPTITSFTKDFQVDYGALKAYIDYLYEGGARVFYNMSYNGRFSLLSDEEIMKLNSTMTTHIKTKYNDCTVITADPMMCSTATTVDFAKKSQDDGADIMCCIFMERYHFDQQVIDHFETIASKSQIGLLVHEQPMDSIRGKLNYPLDLLDRLADIENVVALKEDTKDALYSEQLIKRVSDRLSIIISGRGKRQYIHFKNMGCQAYLVGVASIWPQLAFKFYDALQEENYKSAWDIINNIERPFFEIGMKYGWHPTLKAALHAEGLMGIEERPPLCVLPDDMKNEVLAVYEQIKKHVNNS